MDERDVVALEVAAVDETEQGERRDATRLQQIHYVELHGRQGMFRAMTLNVSRTGVLLTIVDPGFNATIEEGDLGLAGLRVASLFGEGMNIRWRDASVSVEAEIARLDEGERDGRWMFSLGCRFLRELTPAECAVLGFGALATERPRTELEEPEPATREGVSVPADFGGRENAKAKAMLEGVEKSLGAARVKVSRNGAPQSLRALLTAVADAGATDLHIQSNSTVRQRLNGELVELGDRPISAEDARAFVSELLTDEQFEEFVTRGDLDLAHSVEKVGRFRVNVLLSRGVMGMAIRRIPEHVPTIDDLGLSPTCTMLAEKRRGLVLVTGPTGSGKSTTLAAMLHHVNSTRRAHIVTMEDPIEYLHEDRLALVTQREIGRDTENFASALRRALRQDPDVLLVGEMRDIETMALAVTSAETGHLVFGTLHTTSAVQTVGRIVDVFPPAQQAQVRMQLADSLEGVISQVLVPRVGGGVAVAQEALVATSAVRAMIREGKTPQINNLIQTGSRAGMHTLDDSLQDLVSRHVVTLEVAQSRAHDPSRIAAGAERRRR
ncbi:MAG: type IV pilus twitching motility protein PilT [Planctomycetota bacterium]|jgi:twitching motility protein PilT